jgi:hypothetical protein
MTHSSALKISILLVCAFAMPLVDTTNDAFFLGASGMICPRYLEVLKKTRATKNKIVVVACG